MGEDRRQKAIASWKRFYLALEVRLTVLVELLQVVGDTDVEDRVELVASGPAQVALHELVHLLRCVYLVAVQVGLKVVQLVWVGLMGKDGRPVVGLEGLLDSLRVVDKIEDEGVLLLRVSAVEP